MSDSKQPNRAVTILRWVLYLPLAFVASMVAGTIGFYVTDFIGGAGWYTWLISGALSGGSFIGVAFFVAPRMNAIAKWSTLALVTTFGLISALGALLGGGDKSAAFAGVAMIAFGIMFAREPLRKTLDAADGA